MLKDYFMKKFFSTLLLMGSLLTVNATDKDLSLSDQQWLKDLKVLVSLSNNSVDAISGIDNNNNGVRDDVENYILSKYSHDPFQRDMFFKAARKIQEIISLPLNGVIDEHIRLDRELLSIYTCRDYILYRNEVKNIDKELLNKTLFKASVLNTPERLKAYIEHKKILPSNFDELTESELMKDKKSCLALYYSYKNLDDQSTTLIMH
jgi:hypothetical protein